MMQRGKSKYKWIGTSKERGKGVETTGPNGDETCKMFHVVPPQRKYVYIGKVW
jgi:hypothetical protein